MSDLFENHTVGFPTRWLKLLRLKVIEGLLFEYRGNHRKPASCILNNKGIAEWNPLIALAPKPVLFVVGLSKGYGAQLIDSSLL